MNILIFMDMMHTALQAVFKFRSFWVKKLLSGLILSCLYRGQNFLSENKSALGQKLHRIK